MLLWRSGVTEARLDSLLMHQLLNLLQVSERFGVGSEQANAGNDSGMLLGWSDLEVLHGRRVEREVGGRIVGEERSRAACGGFGGRVCPCRCRRYPGGGDIGQRHRRVGSGHESDEVVHTAAEAISRSKGWEPEYPTKGRGDRGVVERFMDYQVAKDERRHDHRRNSRSELLEREAVRPSTLSGFLG